MKKIGKILNAGFNFGMSIVFFLLPKNKNKVLFVSDTRLKLDGNLKYMYDYIPNKYNKVVFLKGDRRAKRSVSDRLKLIYNLSTSKYIFVEDVVQVMAYYVFGKKQEIIQLWHAAGAYKKFGYSRLGEFDGVIHKGYKKYTKAIVSGSGIRKNYAEAFGISIKNVHATGCLRTDMFFDKKYIKNKKLELLKKYPEFKNKKVILFAPTYRGKPYRDISEGGASYDFSKLNLDRIYKDLGNDYVFIFKWHPALYNNIKNGQIKDLDLKKYKDFYYDLSEYREINDLLLITDVLITDYSSVIFDYLLLNKPIVYFTYDLDEYENGRGMYYKFSDYVYGEVAKNSKELINAIKKENLMEDKREEFNNKFMDACDGQSTKKTFDLIFK